MLSIGSLRRTDKLLKERQDAGGRYCEGRILQPGFENDNADHVAVAIEHRAATVSRVDGGARLDEGIPNDCAISVTPVSYTHLPTAVSTSH